MVILIGGASHTGKTLLAQKLLETCGYSYLSMDHLKMGLIRSGQLHLTPESPDADLTASLWPIVREMIRTVIENDQNLTVEGCYIPFDWQKDFSGFYARHIQYVCLVMSETYIRTHFHEIQDHADIIENRLDDTGCTMQSVLQDNAEVWKQVQKYDLPYILIEDTYPLDLEQQILHKEAASLAFRSPDKD